MSKRICTATVFVCMLASIYVSTLIKVPDTVWWDSDYGSAGAITGLGQWAFLNIGAPCGFAGLACAAVMLVWLLADVICSRLRKVIEGKGRE